MALALTVGCAGRKKAAELRPLVWEALSLGTDADFNDVWFADTLNGWIVGGSYQIQGGLVGRTRDGGRTWRFTSGLTTDESAFSFGAVRFLDDHRGVAVGSGGRIFVTDDGGDNWRLAQSGSSGLSDIDFIDRWDGWAAGTGGVYRTQDGGETWAPMMRSSSENGYTWGSAIDFLDSWNGWMVGQSGSVMITADGGATWRRVQTPLAENERPSLWDVCFVDAEHGWVVGEEGTILHTSDRGANWVRQETGVEGAKSKPVLEHIQRRIGVIDTLDLGGRTPGLTLTAVQFIDPDHGWVTGHFGYEARSIVLHTNDGGATWAVEAEVDGQELRALFMLGNDYGWAVGDRVRQVPQVILRHTQTASEPLKISALLR
jgi:photosystem II stability/assembly factor-like uncharacterized protein